MKPGVSVAIMAGGQSRRMGQNKSFVHFNGRPMIETVIEKVANWGDDQMIITNQPEEYAHLGWPMYSDIFPDHGPLAGIYTALFHAAHPHTLIVATDMPWLNQDLLAYMISIRQKADIIIPQWQKFPEPLHAIYHKNCLPSIEACLRAQQLKITGFFKQVNVHVLDRQTIMRFDQDGRSFANINTPQDLDNAN